MLEINKIYNMDCLEGMQKIEDKSIDMILCDLPYGITQNKWDELIPLTDYVVNGKRILHKEDYLLQKYKEGVNCKETLESWEREHKKGLWYYYNKIIKDNGAIVLFGNQPFTSFLVMNNLKHFRYSMVWIKNKFSDFLNANRKPMKVNEDILVFYKKQPTYNPQYTYGEPYKRWNTQGAVDKQTNYGKHKMNISQSDGKRLPLTVLYFNRVERPIHPTQKPVDLCEYLIKTYTNEGETVLDNCMGSGTTAIACINTNRNFIGFELSSEYCEIAEERIRNLNKQVSLFNEGTFAPKKLQNATSDWLDDLLEVE